MAGWYNWCYTVSGGVDCEVGLYSIDFELSNLAKYSMFVANTWELLKTQSTQSHTMRFLTILRFILSSRTYWRCLRSLSRSHASKACKTSQGICHCKHLYASVNSLKCWLPFKSQSWRSWEAPQMDGCPTQTPWRRDNLRVGVVSFRRRHAMKKTLLLSIILVGQ